MQTVVENCVGSRKTADITLAGLVQMGIYSRTHEAVDGYSFTADPFDYVGYHSDSGYDIDITIGVSGLFVATAVQYQNILIKNVLGLKEIYGDDYKSLAGKRIELIKEISDHVTAIKSGVNDMVEARKQANKLEDEKEKANTYSKVIAPFLDNIRYHIDKLELIVDDEIWPLPKYRELLFTS